MLKTKIGTWDLCLGTYDTYMSQVRFCDKNHIFLSGYSEVLKNGYTNTHELPFKNDDYAVWAEDENGEFIIGTYFLVFGKQGVMTFSMIGPNYRYSTNVTVAEKSDNHRILSVAAQLQACKDMKLKFPQIETITGFVDANNRGSYYCAQQAGFTLMPHTPTMFLVKKHIDLKALDEELKIFLENNLRK